MFQQLAGKAASAIHGRLIASSTVPSRRPETLLALAPEALRGAGAFGIQAGGALDLATRFMDGTVPVHDLDGLSDDEIVERLTRVRGIGRWTAEIFSHVPDAAAGRVARRRLRGSHGWGRIHKLEKPPSRRRS